MGGPVLTATVLQFKELRHNGRKVNTGCLLTRHGAQRMCVSAYVHAWQRQFVFLDWLFAGQHVCWLAPECWAREKRHLDSSVWLACVEKLIESLNLNLIKAVGLNVENQNVENQNVASEEHLMNPHVLYPYHCKSGSSNQLLFGCVSCASR